MATYWHYWLRTQLRSKALVVWSIMGALLLLAGYELDVLALDSPRRRLSALGVTAAEAVAWSMAIVGAAAPRMGEDLEELLSPSRLGPVGTLLCRWIGAWLGGGLASLLPIATLIVLANYIGIDSWFSQSILALTSALAGGALLGAWTLLARPVLGVGGAALLGVLVWAGGPAVASGGFSALVPVPAATPTVSPGAAVAGEALAGLGIVLVAALASARARPARTRGTSPRGA